MKQELIPTLLSVSYPSFRAANLSLDLSVVKSDFKCNNWILSMVKKTPIHNVIHASMNDTGLNTASITSSYYGEPWVKILRYMYICPIFLSESLLLEFLISFYRWPSTPFLSAFHSGMTAINKLKNRTCTLLRSVSPRSCILSMGKWIKHYGWPASFKCKSW